jgi:hypothetical protein
VLPPAWGLYRPEAESAGEARRASGADGTLADAALVVRLVLARSLWLPGPDSGSCPGPCGKGTLPSATGGTYVYA